MSSTRDWVTIWQNPRPPLGLRLMAGCYAFGWRAYEATYRLGLRVRKRMPIPVIGVGSLLVGGTGKTPGTIELVRLLKAQGSKVVVLCSGYGGRRWNEITVLQPGELPDPCEVGEEPVLILGALGDTPVIVGRRRVLAAQVALKRFSPDLLVLDDGFQHLPLARDIDLVLLDAEAPLGNGYCLPAGAMREPPSGLRRASAVVLVHEPNDGTTGRGDEKTDGSVEVWKYGSDLESPPHLHTSIHPHIFVSHTPIPVFHAYRCPCGVYRLSDGEPVAAETLAGLPVITLCGIARPDRFENALERLGMSIIQRLRFPDHHLYTPADIDRIPTGQVVMSTEKDAIKLKRLPESQRHEIYILRSRLEFEEALNGWLKNRT